MERIVTQTIPAVVIDNPARRLEPVQRTRCAPAAGRRLRAGRPQAAVDGATREPDTRYADAARHLPRHAARRPVLARRRRRYIARRFEEDRELPEARVEAMLEQVLASPLVPQVAALIEQRLGRPLEPFDIWYNGFRPRGAYTEAQLDAIVAAQVPDRGRVRSGHAEHPAGARLQRRSARDYLAEHIEVDPARGSGHAWGAARCAATRRTCAPASARTAWTTRAYNIAVHELGHNVEQTFSLNEVRPHAAERRAQHGLHRGAGVRVPGPRPGAARPGRSPTPRSEALQAR